MFSFTVPAPKGEPDADIVSAFRELVAAVVVHQTGTGEPYALQIKGRLLSDTEYRNNREHLGIRGILREPVEM